LNSSLTIYQGSLNSSLTIYQGSLNSSLTIYQGSLNSSLTIYQGREEGADSQEEEAREDYVGAVSKREEADKDASLTSVSSGGSGSSSSSSIGVIYEALILQLGSFYRYKLYLHTGRDDSSSSDSSISSSSISSSSIHSLPSHSSSYTGGNENVSRSLVSTPTYDPAALKPGQMLRCRLYRRVGLPPYSYLLLPVDTDILDIPTAIRTQLVLKPSDTAKYPGIEGGSDSSGGSMDDDYEDCMVEDALYDSSSSGGGSGSRVISSTIRRIDIEQQSNVNLVEEMKKEQLFDENKS